MKSILLAMLPWNKKGFNLRGFIISSIVLSTLYVMPGCVYKYTIGDKLEAERQLNAYAEKHLDTCSYIGYVAMRDYGDQWKLFIDDADIVKPEGIQCSRLISKIEEIPGYEEGYKAWKTYDDRGF